MGNAPDKTIDKAFMLQTEALMSNFSRQQPLFHAQQIKFPLSTDQMKIVDATGRRVKLSGGNWSGGHMCRHTVDGLQMRPMRDIAMDIRFKFKMNCIRLTYSLQLIYDNNIVPQKYLKANPQLIGKTSMQIFDITVKTLTEVGLMVILNNHTSTSQWCCSNDDGDGLWWSRQYPEYLFFQHVRDFAKRYKDNPRVIGMDMRNQIRKANGLQPSWGDGNPKTDWKRAAQISSEIALKQAPHWLILVGGINYQLDLTGVKDNPIQLSVPNKLVYTGHFYGFSWPIPSWNVYTYDNFKKRLFNTQTYVRSLGVPYLLGQYGNNNQDIPWKYLMQYLKQTDIDWTYWALDGFKCDPEKDQTYGVFTNDFSQARHPQMLQDMINVGPPIKALNAFDKYYKKLTKKDEKQQTGSERPIKPAEKYKDMAKMSNYQPDIVEEEAIQEKVSNSGGLKQQQALEEKKKKYFDQLEKYGLIQNPSPNQQAQKLSQSNSNQMANQGYNQGTNSNYNQGYNQGGNHGPSQAYPPSQSFNQGYNQPYNQQQGGGNQSNFTLSNSNMNQSSGNFALNPNQQYQDFHQQQYEYYKNQNNQSNQSNQRR